MTVRPRHPGAAGLAVVLLLSGCGGAPSTPRRGSSAAAAPTGRTRLVVEVARERSAPAQATTLTCDPDGGDHPDPAAACRALAALPDPFAAPPAGQACAQVYGGPQTAAVRGTYRGRPVQRSYARQDGCAVARWDRLVPLLPRVAS